jgi:hypothetical protein
VHRLVVRTAKHDEPLRIVVAAIRAAFDVRRVPTPGDRAAIPMTPRAARRTFGGIVCEARPGDATSTRPRYWASHSARSTVAASTTTSSPPARCVAV